MLTAADITGVLALAPTAAIEDADPWGDAGTVDLDEASRMTDRLIRDGVSGIGLCGTTGECAALSWDEKRAFYSAVVETVAGRVPVWAGASALGTRDVVRNMREMLRIGVDGAFVALPMWQTPTLQEAVDFHADLSGAVPDLPILIYANRMFFKFEYPFEFWQAIRAHAPTVIATKVGFEFTRDIFDAVGDRIAFLHGEGGTLTNAYRSIPESVRAAWSTSACMGPEPVVAALAAIAASDEARANQILDDIDSVPFDLPSFADFAKFNIQFEKVRMDAAGYLRAGSPRAPYRDIPEEWRRAAEENARLWSAMRARYRDS